MPPRPPTDPSLRTRESTTFIGPEFELLQQVRSVWGTRVNKKGEVKNVSTPKLLGRCMETSLHLRQKTRMAWAEMMLGLTSAMENLDVEPDVLEVIGWCNGLVQRMLSGTVPPSIANQMTDVADDWISQAIRKRLMEEG